MKGSLLAVGCGVGKRDGHGKVALLQYIAAICLLSLFSLQSAEAVEYKLSMLPLFGTEEINSRIRPLAEYLSRQTGLNIVPVFTADFSQYDQQLSSGAIHIGFENPYVYTKNSSAHEVIAMASTGGRGYHFRGIIITRTDSPLQTIHDLKGKKISIVSRSSAGGFLSQNLTLQEIGINVLRDCIVEVATENKQENVIFTVYTGDADAGFIRESALPQVKEFVPEEAIRVLSSTAWLPNWALSLSKKMPEADKRKILLAIEDLKPGDPALTALKIDGFGPAEDKDYDPVRAGVATPGP
jgi:phosphonate transport system substrate-binding protein